MFLKALDPHCGGETHDESMQRPRGQCIPEKSRTLVKDLIANKSTMVPLPLGTEISPCCGQIPSLGSSQDCLTCEPGEDKQQLVLSSPPVSELAERNSEEPDTVTYFL